jgi:hypothetical protein
MTLVRRMRTVMIMMDSEQCLRDSSRIFGMSQKGYSMIEVKRNMLITCCVPFGNLVQTLADDMQTSICHLR